MKTRLEKICLLLLITIASITLFTVPAHAKTTEFNEDGYICSHDSGVNGGKAVTIIGYKGDKTTLSIPETLGGYEVLHIGDGAFKDNTALKIITIPSTVAYIRSLLPLCGGGWMSYLY